MRAYASEAPVAGESKGAREIWTRFCDEYGIGQTAVPLFATAGEYVRTRTHGERSRQLLVRSDEMEALVEAEAGRVIEDFRSGENKLEGLIYMMFWRDEGSVLPLYIGKAEKYGKNGANLSANFQKITGARGKFARWGDNYAYHVGDLSAAALPAEDPSQLHCLGGPALRGGAQRPSAASTAGVFLVQGLGVGRDRRVARARGHTADVSGVAAHRSRGSGVPRNAPEPRRDQPVVVGPGPTVPIRTLRSKQSPRLGLAGPEWAPTIKAGVHTWTRRS